MTSETSSSPNPLPTGHQLGVDRATSGQVADDVESSSSSSSKTSSRSFSSITTSPSTTSSTTDVSKELFKIGSLQSESTCLDPQDNHATFNPVSKRTAELSEWHKARQRRVSHPPISPSTQATPSSTTRRTSINQEGLQRITEDEPVEFHPSPNAHSMARSRGHQGVTRRPSQRRPQMTQRRSSSTLHVAIQGTAKVKHPGTELSPSQVEVELEKKAAIVSATAAAWVIKQNRAHANAGSDKRFNLQVRGDRQPSFDIIQSSLNASTSSVSELSDQKPIIHRQPLPQPVMSTAQGSIVTSSDDTRDWSSGRYSLDENFCLAACCPGVAYARNKSRLEYLEEMNEPHPGVVSTTNDISTGKPEPKSFFHPLSWASCIAYTLLSPLCLSSHLQHKHRAKTRRRYDVAGSGRTDCTSSLFCGPCELARESREIAFEEDSLADAIDRAGATNSRLVSERCSGLPIKGSEK